jgi:hypothetical protein
MSDFSDGQIRQWREFHPRAVKLLQRHKPFIVVANDEPYYMAVYSLIREHEKEIGRWSEIDERIYQAAEHSVQADGCKCCAANANANR